MPDIKFQFRKQEFTNKKVSNTQTSGLDLIANCNPNPSKSIIHDLKNLQNLTQEFSSSSHVNSTSNSATMFSKNLDLNSTTIDIDPKEHLDLQKDNYLFEFNKLEDILNFINPRNTILVKLKKGFRGLGISLCGGKILPTDNDGQFNESDNFSLINQLIRVKKLHIAHPASECGLIDENDFILYVNDHCFVGLTYIEAFNILHSVQDEVTLRIFKFNQCPLELQRYLLPKESSIFDNSSSEFSREFSGTDQNIFESTRINDLDNGQINKSYNRIRNVVLIKKDNSLGFTLSKIENEGFYVKQILKEPASLEKINPGDRILSVNGTSLDGLDLNDAIKLLRSLPDLCEFKLEQSCDLSDTEDCKHDYTDTTDNSINYNDQSDLEDDNQFKKKQLRHEVKIMLDSRNKDPLHNRLKRKELRKTKGESTNSELKDERKNSDSKLGNCVEDSSRSIFDKSDRLDNSSDYKSSFNLNKNLDDNSDFKPDHTSDYRNSKFNKENYETAFIKLNNNQNESQFLRQSSVIDFSRNELKNKSTENGLTKQNNNLNKWRNQIMILSDENDDVENLKNAFKFDKNSTEKVKQLKELNDEQDSGFGDLMNKTSNPNLNLSLKNKLNKLNQLNDYKWNNNQASADIIQLNDIQLKLNTNCLINENSIYRNIQDALFFYVFLDKGVGWHGRCGFSLTDDQLHDYRVVNTIRHGFSACIVKEVYPNSLAYSTDIKIGDKLLEVNDEQMINKPVQTVIKELRKLKGKIKLLFLKKAY